MAGKGPLASIACSILTTSETTRAQVFYLEEFRWQLREALVTCMAELGIAPLAALRQPSASAKCSPGVSRTISVCPFVGRPACRACSQHGSSRSAITPVFSARSTRFDMAPPMALIWFC